MLNHNILITHNPVPLYRINDETHIYYAVQVYQDNGGVLRKSGALLEPHQLHAAPNSYFGSAYLHAHHKNIIIAHHGTQNAADWKTNIELITRQLNQQQVCAWDFAKKIIETYGPEYRYSFTGHSL